MEKTKGLRLFLPLHKFTKKLLNLIRLFFLHVHLLKFGYPLSHKILNSLQSIYWFFLSFPCLFKIYFYCCLLSKCLSLHEKYYAHIIDF